MVAIVANSLNVLIHQFGGLPLSWQKLAMLSVYRLLGVLKLSSISPIPTLRQHMNRIPA